MMLGMIGLLASRNLIIDFPYPWLKSQLALMIPVPEITNEQVPWWSHAVAICKPFQWQVITGNANGLRFQFNN